MKKIISILIAGVFIFATACASQQVSAPAELQLPQQDQIVEMRVSDQRSDSDVKNEITSSFSSGSGTDSLFENIFDEGFNKSEYLEDTDIDVHDAENAILLIFKTEDESQYVYYFYKFSDDAEYCYFEDAQSDFKLFKAPMSFWNYLEEQYNQ